MPAFEFHDVLAALFDGDKTPSEMHERCQHLDLETVRAQIGNLRRKQMLRDARDEDGAILMRGDEHVYTLSPTGREWLERWTI